jgi:hypothetical protein
MQDDDSMNWIGSLVRLAAFTTAGGRYRLV